MRNFLSSLRRCRGDILAAQREETHVAGKWQDTVSEAREATGFTGEVVHRTVDDIGAGLRLDHRADFYTELGALSDSGSFEAFHRRQQDPHGGQYGGVTASLWGHCEP